MGIFDEATIKSVNDMLSKVSEGIEILYFEKPNHELNPYYDEMLDVIKNANEKIKVKKMGKEDIVKYKIDKLPTIQIVGKNKGTIRFCGLPSGYEFGAFLQDIIDISEGKSHLSKATIEYLQSLDKEVNLKVFVTPTCPYCPQAVKLAHDFAMHSDKITAEMINAMEFNELANKFHVQGVPHTVINDGKEEFVGAYPEDNALEFIKKL